MEQLEKDRHFIESEFPRALSRLKPTQQPAWGQMSPVQLLDHLRASMVLSTRDEPRELSVPESKLPAMRAFLFSDKPMPRAAPKPDIFSTEERPDATDFAATRQQVEDARQMMLAQFDEQPDFSSVHPNFGRLDVAGWLRMHHKHFYHHLQQYGLLPRP